MCTLILATRVFDDSATFLASNRDEQLDRPSTGPIRWDGDPAFVAPRDELRGGTWLGVNEHGLLTAITNRFGEARNAEKRSRGELVLIALTQPRAATAAEKICSLDPADFNPYHLVIADAAGAHVVWSDGHDAHGEELEPGVHVLTERSFAASDNARKEFLDARISQLRADGELDRQAVVDLLAVRRDGDIDCTCVSLPQLNYGTRSSTVVDVDQRRLEFADGAPCDVDYQDHSDLLRELL